MDNNYCLRLENLSFRFSPASPHFFKNIEIEFSPHKLNFIQGKNGSGKSTLFRIMQGQIAPQEEISGVFHFNDQIFTITNNESSNRSFGSSVALVHQNVTVMIADQFTFEQNLQYAAMPKYPGLSALSKLKSLPPFVETLGLDYAKPVDRMSGGQKQILAILMALQKDTRILLLDEPTAALDEKNANLIMHFLQELAKTTNILIIIISHDQQLMSSYKELSAFFLVEEDVKSKERRVKRVDKELF